ncbi:asparagine synthetase domain-containing protein 1-like [Schistocerca gregaria]|uniref:asparagine synthetase domain-containing protein 1-like n=1 Tax=Schistocerca gregaria TaxID=7010 RepID=UPI00211E948E|nr:asparagine synthetase domain-containing protein 1-like [Schistocerca gregaria]
MCGIAALIRVRHGLTRNECMGEGEDCRGSVGLSDGSLEEWSATPPAGLSELDISDFALDLRRLLANRGRGGYDSLRFSVDENMGESVLEEGGEEKKVEVEFHGYRESAARPSITSRRLLSSWASLDGRESSIEGALLWDGEDVGADFLERISLCAAVQGGIEPCELIRLMSSVEGPWSMIYYSMRERAIWFGRDARGRRSLLVGSVRGDSDDRLEVICVSSVAMHRAGLAIKWSDVDTRGLYRFDVCQKQIKVCPWPEKGGLRFRIDLCRSAQRPMDLDQREVSLCSLVDELLRLLRESVRLCIFPRGGALASSSDWSADDAHADVAVLFSGGLDSTILAALVDLELPSCHSVDLINVSFGSESEVLETPDRLNATDSYRALCAASPDRPWRLVLVDVSKEELQENLPRITSLAYPSDTIMDISISAPLWFASRGSGVAASVSSKPTCGWAPYRSRARTLLVGTGADEQFGGYGRHRVQYRKNGWEGLQNELNKDVARLWKRNLGRDDRVLKDHGRRVCLPYLDERLMSWVAERQLCDLVDMDLPPGEGDKYLLRLLAKRLKLGPASTLPKKAIQFGTNIVKQMPRGRGTDAFVL